MSAPQQPLPADPYFCWAQDTGFTGHSALQGGANGYLPVLVTGDLAAAPARWRVPPLYRGAYPPPFWTAWVPAADLASLADLPMDFSMSLPVTEPSELPAGVTPAAREAELVIGVIDQGCAFLNRAFSHAGAPRQTRFLSLWRQRPDPVDAPWQVPAEMGYGLELTGEAIDHLLAPLSTPADEARAYEELGYPVNAQRRFSAELHGTHVLDIAAGLPQPLPPAVSAKPAAMDAAAQAALVFVELPQPLTKDATGASCDAFVLDAVRYILHRAGSKARVLINLSIGSFAGPHDGSSLLERALDALVAAEGGRLSICVAAGNAALERWHAQGRLRRLPRGESATFTWRTVPGDETDSFLELWAFGEAGAPLPPLQVDVIAPDGRSRLQASLPGGAARDGLRLQDRLQACLDLRERPALDGRPRALALLSLAPTAGPRAGQPAGAWQVTVRRSASPAQLSLAVWLQRDTPGPTRDLLQSALEGVSDNLTIDGSGATSSLAGASRLVVVGAVGDSDAKPSRYSPTRGIRAWGASDESPSAPGKICTGGLSGSHDRIAGTSAATPMVLRAMANDPDRAHALARPANGKVPILGAAPRTSPRTASRTRRAARHAAAAGA